VLSNIAEAIQTDTKDSIDVISSAGPKYMASSARGRFNKDWWIEDGFILDV